MKFLVTLLVTANLTAHAVLGSSIHQSDCTSPGMEHRNHGNHEHSDHCGEPGRHPTPQQCQQQCCVFLASRAVAHPIELGPWFTPLLTPTVQTPPVDSSEFSRILAEDWLHPAGPALYVWQCVWMI